jgi:ubiquinone/menaquinone biosynthesis C-methylase UbiE
VGAAAGDSAPRPRRGLGRLTFAVEAGPGVRLLDLGGGNGKRTERVAAGATEVVVLDPDPRRLAQGRAQRPRIRFVEGTAEAIPFEPGRFDRVMARMSLHHVRDPPKVLEEAGRVLAPGGKLVVWDLDPDAPLARLFRWMHRRDPHGPLNFLPPEELAARARAAGFRSVTVERVGRAFLVTAVR